MALEKTFRELTGQLRTLRDRLEELRVTVVEDRPRKNDAALVDDLEYTVEDVLGWLHDTLKNSARAEQAVGHPMDLEQARQSLARCQDLFHCVDQAFGAKLVSYERLKDLTGFAGERKGEWPSWASSVKQGIEQSAPALEQSRKALAECWEEIAEKAGTTSISVRATNVGQTIVAPVERRTVKKQGVT
jgi:hypothetical protein